MKKSFAILTILLMAFTISSCGSNSQYGDNHSVTLKSLGVDNANDAQALLDSKVDKIPSIEGYENKIKVTENNVVETIKIDFDKIDADKINEIPGLNFIGDPSKNISLEKSIKELKKSGFKEVDEKK